MIMNTAVHLCDSVCGSTCDDPVQLYCRRRVMAAQAATDNIVERASSTAFVENV